MSRSFSLAALAVIAVAGGTSVVAAQPQVQPAQPQQPGPAPGNAHVRVRGQYTVQPVVGPAPVQPTVVPVPAQPGAVGSVQIRPAQPPGGAVVRVQPGQPGQPGQNVTIPSEVIVILGLEAAGTVDASIANEPALRQPAFQVFRTMRLLARPQLALMLGRPAVVDLPNGRRMQLLVIERRADGRFQVRISINRPGLADYLPSLTLVLSPGAPFFQVGQAHAGGTLVIGVRIGRNFDRVRGRLSPDFRTRVLTPRNKDA